MLTLSILVVVTYKQIQLCKILSPTYLIRYVRGRSYNTKIEERINFDKIQRLTEILKNLKSWWNIKETKLGLKNRWKFQLQET